MNAASPGGAEARTSSTGLVALLLAIAGVVVMPLLSVIVGLLLSSSRSAFTAIAIVLGLGALAIVVATILAIVTLARGGAGKTSAIVALVLGVLSIPVGIFASFWALLFSAGSGLHGRPFRGGAGTTARTTPTHAGTDWSEGGPCPDLHGIDPKVRKQLAEAWLADAALEHASVAAFGALALDLIALGAPPALVRRSHEAALEEIAHARDCFALASAYAGCSLTAAPFPEVRAPVPDESLEARLERLAVESAVDGCIGEGCAAAAARDAMTRASDPVVREVLARIARDEQSHADSAWELLGWCLAKGGSTVARAVDDALARHASTPASVRRPPTDLAHHGRIDEAGWGAARASTTKAVVARLAL
jgi:hypothetical protein